MRDKLVPPKGFIVTVVLCTGTSTSGVGLNMNTLGMHDTMHIEVGDDRL